MAEAAARAGDNIHHTSALAGFIVGTIIGVALIAAVAFATFTCGFGAALVAGLLAGGAASGIRSLSESIGSKCKSTTGKIRASGCSNNVLINGRLAARAVVSSAECAKDMPMAPIAEGSSNVFINQNAAARKDDKIQCGATISEGSDNVLIGGGKVQYLPVKDEVPDWVRKASDILFTVAGIAGGAAGAFKQVGGVLNKCALKFVGTFVAGEIAGGYITDKAMQAIGGLFGNPVDITNGQKILFDEHELDFVISARLPIFWQRYYSSELDEGILGKGWRLGFEVSLSKTKNEIIYCGRTGQKTFFPHLAIGEYSYSAESQLYFYRMINGRHVIRTLDDIYSVFPDFEDNKIVYLEHIEDIDHNFIRFHYNENNPQQLVGVSDSQNNYLICHWHPNLARLLSVEQLVDGKKETVIRYSYDENGNLLAVYNKSGIRTRRFVYDQNHLMVEHTNIFGMQCFYRWQQVDKDKWCVVESHNSEGERARYTYDFNHGQTSVIDERDLKATWKFDEQQQVVCFEDFNQDIYNIEYNPQGMPVLFHLPGDRYIKLARDGLNRIVEEIDPLGRTTRTDYYLNTLNVIRKTFPDSSVWQAKYDEKGHLLVANDPLGYKTSYCYDEQGLPVQIIDANGGTKSLIWNDTAQLQQYTDCSGKAVYYTWNKHGNLVSSGNMLGEITHFLYNAQNELQAIKYPDNTQEHFSYYPTGLLKYHQDTAGRRREWCYNRRGQSLQYTDKLNRKLHYYYDAKGNLKRLLNANGGEYRFSYDVSGRLAEELRPDKTRCLFHYDAAGLPARLGWLGAEHSEKLPQYRQKDYQYDKGGRLVRHCTAMASCFYDYDAADRLVQLERKPTPQGTDNGILDNLLRFHWDKNGRLLEEHQDGEVISYQWNPLGELTDLHLPDNNSLHWLSYGSGHISAIRFNQRVVTEFERDDLHREILRTQGALTQRQGYDLRGRRSWQSAYTEDIVDKTVAKPQQGKLWRTFHFDNAGDLTQTDDAFRGVQRYLYDAESRLLDYEAPKPEGGREQFSYDDADNIYALPDVEWNNIHNGKPDGFRTNRVPFWKGTGFRYDGFGNLIERTQGSQTQYFAYDDEHRMIKAWGDGPNGRYQADYRYDALGRRTEKSITYQDKSAAVVTGFRWQGLRLIQEVSAEHTRSYVYDPNESYTPLARITQQEDQLEIDYFHVDLNGTPLELTNSAGDIIWCGKYYAWGKLQPQVHLKEEIPGLPYQPLRYPGQYYDNETGLHYNTFRYYDPEIGRFTTQDPIGLEGGMNLYAYAPNPLTWIDPLGLSDNPLVGLDLVNMTKKQISEILSNADNISWKGGSPDGRFAQWKFTDTGTTAVRLDPPDKVTLYDHAHLYDKAGNSLDINGNVVDSNLPAAHNNTGC
ncbi:RHS repeat-associated core domain-containing protein [Yersinia pekkanenii]|uniref:RHS/YD repeat-containing protein n=1 Tax=Yersinia pekkanenii TaxID=1288385 RepID=A0A0T9PNJ8_9GAMM|nr:RHS repeat-associated core domain-containing protein [Yersinia pekkanenii]CNH74158.1 RHS/YD repeat-containing protein [Yersinia pekkanenii]CRY68022.1 RHS/YD repeat-containing protein [Yersinia pekkanenii]